MIERTVATLGVLRHRWLTVNSPDGERAMQVDNWAKFLSQSEPIPSKPETAARDGSTPSTDHAA